MAGDEEGTVSPAEVRNVHAGPITCSRSTNTADGYMRLKPAAIKSHGLHLFTRNNFDDLPPMNNVQ
jgi:hypothetical protein